MLDRAGERAAPLHLDLHPMNVLVEGSRVSAVLDWANARAGDPRADLARTASILRFAPLAAEGPAPLTRPIRRLLETGWSRGYRGAAVMVHDLSPRLGRRDLPWLTPAFLADVQEWGATWRRSAGLAE